MGLRSHLVIPRLQRCSGFNVVYVLSLVKRRRLDPNKSQPLPYKDGQPHFITTTLKIICAPGTQLNGHNMRPLNLTMSTINFSPTFSLLSRIPSKRISCLHHWASNTKFVALPSSLQTHLRVQICGNVEGVGTWSTISTSSTRGGERGVLEVPGKTRKS